MKKITLILIGLITLNAFGQDLISFESGEGYSLGDINGQDNWFVSASGPTPIVNQEVSNEQASDGSFSLRLSEDPAFGGQAQINTGAFYPLAGPLDTAMTILSFDIYIDSFSGTRFDVGFDNTVEDLTITAVAVNTGGSVNVYTNEVDGGDNSTVEFNDTGEDLVEDTWYNVRIEINNNNQEVFLDDVSIFSGTLGISNVDIQRLVVVHDNKGGVFFFDNFRINDDSLSNTDVALNNYDFRFASSTEELLLNSPSQIMEQVSVFNMMGQQVLNKRLGNNSERIGLKNLSSGMYVAQISVNGSVETLKFIKN